MSVDSLMNSVQSQLRFDNYEGAFRELYNGFQDSDEIGEQEAQRLTAYLVDQLEDYASQELDKDEFGAAPAYNRVFDATTWATELELFMDQERSEKVANLRNKAAEIGLERELERASQYQENSDEYPSAAYSEAWRALENAESFSNLTDRKTEEVSKKKDEIASEGKEASLKDAFESLKFLANMTSEEAKEYEEQMHQPGSLEDAAYELVNRASIDLDEARKYSDHLGITFPEDLENYDDEEAREIIEQSIRGLANITDRVPDQVQQSISLSREHIDQMEKIMEVDLGFYTSELDAIQKRADKMRPLTSNINGALATLASIDNAGDTEGRIETELVDNEDEEQRPVSFTRLRDPEGDYRQARRMFEEAVDQFNNNEDISDQDSRKFEDELKDLEKSLKLYEQVFEE